MDTSVITEVIAAVGGLTGVGAAVTGGVKWLFKGRVDDLKEENVRAWQEVDRARKDADRWKQESKELAKSQRKYRRQAEIVTTGTPTVPPPAPDEDDTRQLMIWAREDEAWAAQREQERTLQRVAPLPGGLPLEGLSGLRGSGPLEGELRSYLNDTSSTPPTGYDARALAPPFPPQMPPYRKRLPSRKG